VTSSCLLGIDVGTTALKVVVLHRERGIVAQQSLPHELRSPHPGWAEEDSEAWWATTTAAIREILRQIPAEEIAAVGVGGMVPAMVLLDESGRPLRPSIQQNDARAAAEVQALQDEVDGDEFFAVTGGVPSQQNIAPRWAWLATHEPDVVTQTATLFGSYDYIVFRLTGERSVEQNWAAESGLYDIHRRCWHRAYLHAARIDEAILPPVHAPTDIVGAITPAVAAETGLLSGTPVVAGTADHVAAALGAGVTSHGDLLVKFGGAGDILFCTDTMRPDRHFFFDYHDVPGLILINGCMASSGSTIKWFSRELAGGATPDILDAEAAVVPVGSAGIVALPYFLGEKSPIFDPRARGVFCGVMLHHTRAHLYRALLESVCYGFRHHVDLLRAAGFDIRRIRATDGGGRSALWMQIAADVLGHPVEVVGGESASALGAAFVAGSSVGVFQSWDDIERFAGVSALYTPRLEAVARYDETYGVYRELYEDIKPLLHRLTAFEADDVREGV
jgi:xylulokinase